MSITPTPIHRSNYHRVKKSYDELARGQSRDLIGGGNGNTPPSLTINMSSVKLKQLASSNTNYLSPINTLVSQHEISMAVDVSTLSVLVHLSNPS